MYYILGQKSNDVRLANTLASRSKRFYCWSCLSVILEPRLLTKGPTQRKHQSLGDVEVKTPEDSKYYRITIKNYSIDAEKVPERMMTQRVLSTPARALFIIMPCSR